ncbi:DNA-binding HxlR family transcriptional regulator [Pseudoclavibacter chungangensis]|uniref:winged helix-turn-helix transcriptional regulator n=1 Tax=Pseudoclavibacter chungangensis TaxID=587635 RepID=UPI00179E9850|nr:helix-turn-helix domain-containing protein [Pseudoclavibacter chungangensis]NYJ68389.1 DNA-binding HxlR family transcriptional regulator [Pseudoclavibacter chungangensis]
MDDDRWTCGVNVVFDLVGSKWKPTILWRLAEGDRRFAELRRAIVPITEKVLTEQLRQLERDGLVERSDDGGFPRRVVYGLSDDGAELERVLDAVGHWGDAHADDIRERRAAAPRRSGTPAA